MSLIENTFVIKTNSANIPVNTHVPLGEYAGSREVRLRQDRILPQTADMFAYNYLVSSTHSVIWKRKQIFCGLYKVKQNFI